MTRLFTFGCSFTWWPWPTWADIIAYDLDIPHYNWGMPGLGNVGIHSRLLECDLRNKFTKDDVILVVWSSWTREDRYNIKHKSLIHESWNGTGDVFHSYDKAFIENYWSMNNDLIKNSTAILSSNRMFDIKFNGHITKPIVNLYNEKNLSFSSHEKVIAPFYERHIPNDGEYQENVKHKCRYPYINESHPDILSHLEYVQEFISIKLGKPLNKKTVDFFTEMHHTLYDFIETTMDTNSGIDYRQQIPNVLNQFNWKNKDIKGF